MSREGTIDILPYLIEDGMFLFFGGMKNYFVKFKTALPDEPKVFRLDV